MYFTYVKFWWEGSLPEIHAAFECVTQHLARGKRYLVGDRLTRVDITFAAVVAPIIIPEEFGGAHLRIENVPRELREEAIQLRAPAGQIAL